jgi:hypothetical protein
MPSLGELPASTLLCAACVECVVRLSGSQKGPSVNGGTRGTPLILPIVRDELLSAFRVAVGALVQYLESHLAFEPRIPRTVNSPTSTLTQECENPVRSERRFKFLGSGAPAFIELYEGRFYTR